jgi:hypothetical protein
MTDNVYPYQAKDEYCKYDETTATKFRLCNWSRLWSIVSPAPLKEALVKSPVMTGIAVRTDSFKQYSSGIYDDK